jgi:hypothetical protein
MLPYGMGMPISVFMIEPQQAMLMQQSQDAFRMRRRCWMKNIRKGKHQAAAAGMREDGDHYADSETRLNQVVYEMKLKPSLFQN